MTYGTLDIITEDREDYYKIKADYEVEIILQRLFPASKRYPLRVRIHPESTKIMNMVVREYELEIKDKERWKSEL